MISIEDFEWMVITGDYDGVQKAIASGFNVNSRRRGKVSIIEGAQPGKDYKMIHILWKAGAKPETPWLERLFSDFEKGIIPENPKIHKNYKKVNTEDFSLSKLKLKKGNLYINKKSFGFEIPIEPFELSNVTNETVISAEDINYKLDLDNFIAETVNFPTYPEDGCIESSICINNMHIPVDIKWINFVEYNKKSKTIKIRFLIETDFKYLDLKRESVILNATMTVIQG